MKLSDQLHELIRHRTQNHITLLRGLTIAYTPATAKTPHRLCLSRPDTATPSQHEAKTVWSHLLHAPAFTRPYLRTTFQHDHRGCFIIEWHHGTQQELNL